LPLPATTLKIRARGNFKFQHGDICKGFDMNIRHSSERFSSLMSAAFVKAEERVFSNEIAWALRFAVILNCILYPMIVFFIASPMFARFWTLQDPIVSPLNFIPGLDALRFELLHNANILWSSPRNFGAPILANEVQSAPMFPLTLGLIWAPEPYFWNILVSVRLVLLGMGTYLVGSQVLNANGWAPSSSRSCLRIPYMSAVGLIIHGRTASLPASG
jgi:hypothetical protein